MNRLVIILLQQRGRSLPRLILFLLLSAQLSVVAGSCHAQSGPDPQLTLGSQPLETQRVFHLYRTSALPREDAAVAPLSTKQKFELFRKSGVDPGVVVIAAAIAGIQQAGDLSPMYGKNSTAYAQRFGGMVAVMEGGTLLTQAALPSAFHQDPRYFPKRTGSVLSRVGYAISRTVITYRDDGKKTFNSSQIAGIALDTAATNLYYPNAERTAARNSTGFGIAIGVSAGVNILREFSPHR